jgi:subtilisin family serine protease
LTGKGEGDGAAFGRTVAGAGASVSPASRLRRQRLLGGAFVPDYADVPVLAHYVRAIEATGARVRHVSRWLNAVSVEADHAVARRLADLAFVTRITPVSRTEKAHLPPGDYGGSLTQNLGIHSPAAHDSGYSAAGVVVAIFDTGFRKDHVATAPIRRIAEWDFVHSDGETSNQPGDNPTEWDHGTGTWSLLAAYWPGELVGPAFNASFVLAKTLEPGAPSASEDHWVAAAEWADSIGVDILSSSIVASHNYGELDGTTTPMAQAANTLTRHGVLVVCAMGNSGPATGTLSTPADCDSVLAVGSVDQSYQISSFSSRGPTFDGRGKPDLVAQGVNAIWAEPSCSNCLGSYPGTSIATPLVSGAAALVQSRRLTPSGAPSRSAMP